MSDDADLDALRSVTGSLTSTLASVRPEQWTSPTPCDDWDLQALVDHVTGGNWFTIAILDGDPADAAMAATRARFALGSVTGTDATESLDQQRAAFTRPGILDRTWNHVAGDLSGRHVLRLRLHDLIVHTWDAQQVVRPGAPVPDDLARWGLAEIDDATSVTKQHFHISGRTSQPHLEASNAYLALFGRASAARG